MSQITLTQPRKVQHWQRLCRAQMRSPHVKRADLSSDGQSVPFEQALSNLAHAYLRDRAPQLLEHELGFQLIEKNEDNDRAVGVFGFKVGNQLLYGPVFFLNGELKGHELLYLKDSDTFVPMKENWINYVLNRKPNVIGEEIAPQLSQVGVDRPTMDIFRDSPQKFASAQPEWLQAGLPGLLYALGRPERPSLQVPGLLKSSAAASMYFLQLLDSFPTVAPVVVECYGDSIVKDAIDTARTRDTACPIEAKREPMEILRGSIWQEKSALDLAREQDPTRTGKLRIWTYSDSIHCDRGLTVKQAETLKRDGVYIKDDRENTSKAFRIQEPLALQNPDETGHYDVLCKPDSFEKCLFIHAPFNARGSRPNGVLVRLGDGDTKAWTETHPGAIFAVEQHSGKDYKSWFDCLSDAKSLDVGSTYVLIAANGQGTSVFEVKKSLPAEGEETCYEVNWRNRYGARRPDHLPPVAERRYEYDSDNNGPDQIVLNRIKGNRFVARMCNLLVPPGTKALKIKGPQKPEKDEDGCCCSPVTCGDWSESSDPPALRPGNHVDLQLGIYKTSAELTIHNNGTEAIVDGSRMAPTAAFIRLVRNYGLNQKSARALLKEAEVKRGVRCRIKFAEPYGMLSNAPPAPPFPEFETGTDDYMGSGMPTVYGGEREVPVDGLQGAPNEPDMSLQPEPMMAQQIAQAAQTGQKEVLDTSLLSNLLRGSQNDTLIDRHLPNLMKGLDSLGRLLFNLYWHHDKFEDRYGASNLPDLEDAMRNAFENMGDVTLELKQKTIEPYPDEGVDVNFGEGEA